MNTLKKYPLLSFVLLNYLITWTIAFPLIATRQGWLGINVSYKLHYLTAYGPLIAAVITIYITEGKGGLQKLYNSLTKWKVKPFWFIISAFSPIALYIIGAVIALFVNGSPPDLTSLGYINYMPYLGFATWIFWILNSGLGEETGWRGYALPQL